MKTKAMKKIKSLSLLIIVLVSQNFTLNAQEKEQPWSWYVLGSINQYNGPEENQLFRKWEGIDFINTGAKYFLNNSFNLSSGISVGKLRRHFSSEESVNRSFMDLDLLLEYKLNNGYILKETSKFKPYLTAGVGGLYSKKKVDLNVPFGAAIRYEITHDVDLQVSSLYKWAATNDDFNGYLQNSFGIVITPNKKGDKDSDGDGVVDRKDKCPNLAGLTSNSGCPSDKDGDGVYDNEDKCPDVKGLAANKGCPEVDQASITILQQALTGIQFESGNAVIKPSSFPILDKVAEVMKLHTEYDLSIEGHTDNTGDAGQNLTLSKDRAQAAKKYLEDHGVSSSRLKSEGYGVTRPVADNNTKEGRAKNRRVEFKVVF